MAARVADDKVGRKAVFVDDEVGLKILIYLAIRNAIVTSEGNCLHISNLGSKVFLNCA